MKSWSLISFLFLLFAVSCAEPKATVFLDGSLNEEETLKFCFTGDMGKDTPHQQAVSDALKREDCNRIFFLGDLVYPSGINSIDDEEFTKKFLEYYQPLLDDKPDLYINLLLGNHDHKGSPESWKKIAEINDHFFFPNYYYMIDYGGLCFVALDTSLYYYLSEVKELTNQTTWIQGLQARLKKCDVKIAVTHHPFKATGYDPEDDWEGASGALKAFLDTYVIGVFDIHLAGHVHVVKDDGIEDGTRMLVSGAGGEARGENKGGYIVLAWTRSNPKRISYNLKYIDTSLLVVDDTETSQMQEEYDPEYVIKKHVLEEGFFIKVWHSIKALFH